MDTRKGTTEEIGYTFVSNVMQPYSVGTINADKTYELTENLFVVKDMASDSPDGSSLILPLAPVLNS